MHTGDMASWTVARDWQSQTGEKKSRSICMRISAEAAEASDPSRLLVSSYASSPLTFGKPSPQNLGLLALRQYEDNANTTSTLVLMAAGHCVGIVNEK